MRSFLPWALLLVVVRGAIVLSLGDAFFYGEEMEKATAGKAMLDGLGIPHHQLAYHYYEGGGFVYSHLKALAFNLVGESLLANKLVALASCIGVLGAGWWACNRAFGQMSAHVFAALYVFAPAAVQKLSMISLGIHHEACFFMFCALGMTATLLKGQQPWRYTVLGLCLGFGMYFSWLIALVAITCAGALVMRWRGDLKWTWALCGIAGAYVGAKPIRLMYKRVGEAVFDIHGTGLTDAGSSSTSEALREFLRSIFIEGALGGLVFVIAWPLVIGGALVLGWRASSLAESGWGRSFRCFAAFGLVFIAAYLSSAFVQGRVYHFFLMLRLVPLWAVGIALVAAVIGRSWEDAGRESRAWIAGAGLVALGIFATFECIAEGRPGDPAANWKALKAERGYVYPSYFAKLVPHLDGGVEEKLGVLLRFNEAEAGLLREGIAAELFRRHGEGFDQDYLAARDLVESVEPGGFGGYQLGLGPLLVDWHGDDLIGCLLMTQSKGMDAPLLAEALGRTGRGVSPRGSEISLEAVEALLLEDLTLVKDRAGAVPFARGVGWRLHRVLHRMVYQPWRAGLFIDSAPPTLRDSVRMGYMEAARQGCLNASP